MPRQARKRGKRAVGAPPPSGTLPPSRFDAPADRIRWACGVVGLTLDELAALSGLPRSTLARALDSRGAGITLDTMMRLSYALGMAPSELWPGLHVRPPMPMRLAHDAVYAALALGLIAVRCDLVNRIETRTPPRNLCSLSPRPLDAVPSPLWDGLAADAPPLPPLS